MTMLAETVDAVIGIDTHRDTHEVEIADPAGKPIMTKSLTNMEASEGCSSDFAEHAPVTDSSQAITEAPE